MSKRKQNRQTDARIERAWRIKVEEIREGRSKAIVQGQRKVKISRDDDDQREREGAGGRLGREKEEKRSEAKKTVGAKGREQLTAECDENGKGQERDQD